MSIGYHWIATGAKFFDFVVTQPQYIRIKTEKTGQKFIYRSNLDRIRKYPFEDQVEYVDITTKVLGHDTKTLDLAWGPDLKPEPKPYEPKIGDMVTLISGDYIDAKHMVGNTYAVEEVNQTSDKYNLVKLNGLHFFASDVKFTGVNAKQIQDACDEVYNIMKNVTIPKLENIATTESGPFQRPARSFSPVKWVWSNFQKTILLGGVSGVSGVGYWLYNNVSIMWG